MAFGLATIWLGGETTILPKLRRLYWDACAWLGLINEEPSKRRELEMIYDAARRGNCELWTSTWSVVECFREDAETHAEKPLPEARHARIRAFFNQPFIKKIPVDAKIADRAAELLRATKGLRKKGDAVHLASALWWSADALHTYDHADLLHLSHTLLDRSGRPLPICTPNEATDGPLFAGRRG